MTEGDIVRNCAPTLAGIKTGSLFSCSYDCTDGLRRDLRQLNRRLGDRGLRVLPLRLSNRKALIYLYRPQKLREDLRDVAAAQLLLNQGYRLESPEVCVSQLARKLRSQEEFPHEIGLFLGYPPEDVQGFMENRAGCCKCTGCWKVYGDETAAQSRFAQYKNCTQSYCHQWEQGKPIEGLTVRS